MYKQHLEQISIAVMSDTHDFHHQINIQQLPKADIFIHAGDFTQLSTQDQLERFRSFLSQLPYKHKIVIAGNHDFVLDKESYNSKLSKMMHSGTPLDSEEEIKKLKEVCIYLEHEMVEIQGIKIFGSPYTPQFYDWGFMYKQSEGQKLWSTIPEGTDVLVTHGPPFGIMDKCFDGADAGCKELLKYVQKIKPQVHIFGHIHEGFGHKQVNGVHYYNASTTDQNYQIRNPPHLIKIQKKK